MANRYPLIIDTADGNKIKELPAGDNLYLRNNSIEEVQDINALGTIDAAAITIAGQPIVAQSFTDLTDVPSNYNNSAGNFLRVNPTADGIIFSEVNDLGNISVDNLTLETGNISPASDNSNQIGLPDKRFWKIHAGSFLGSLRGNDGTLVFDAATNRISYSAVYGAPTALSEFTNDMGFLDSEGIDAAISAALASGSFDTDLVGSVFGDDSTLLVDGVNSVLKTYTLDQVGATDGQALVWSDSNQRWEPGAAVGTGGLEGLTVTQDGARTNVGKNLTEDNNSITSQLYVQPNQIGLQTILNPDGLNNNSTGSVNVTNDAVEISISEESIGGNSTVGLLIAGTGLELFQSDGVTTSIVTVNGSNVTTSGTITAGNIVADGLEFTGAGVVTVESGSNLILNAANGAGNIVGSGSRITNIADPLDLQDAATKSYVDAVFLGGGVAFYEGDMKGSVFADDSSLMLDGINRQLSIDKITFTDNSVVSYQDNVSCAPTVDTVVYTASSNRKRALRLFAMAQGRTDASAIIETQACDIVAVYGYTGDTVTVSVYGLTYSSGSPLATFDGQWNATTNRIEITCMPTSSTYGVTVNVHSLELETND